MATMPIRRAPTIVSFDAEALLETLLEQLGDGLRTFAEYNHGDYQVLYASDRLLDGVGGEDAFAELAERYYSFVHLDFVERELFADLSPAAGAVKTYITRLERATFVRYLVGDEGVFFSVDPDTHVVPLVERLDDLVS